LNYDRYQRRVALLRLFDRDIRARDNAAPFSTLIGNELVVSSATLPPAGSTAIFANCSLTSGNISNVCNLLI